MKARRNRLYAQAERLLNENPNMNYLDLAFKLKCANKKAAHLVRVFRSVNESQYVNPMTGQSGEREQRTHGRSRKVE